MYHFTVSMALMDYLPVIFFGVTMVILQQDLYGKMRPGVYTLFSAGTVNVFMAGFLKATWKLLYAANICDFVLLEKMFLPVNSIGLLMVGLSLIGMMCCKRKGVSVLSVVPAAVRGSFLFIMMMVVGLGSMCAVLSVLAARMRKKGTTLLFVLSFAAAMGMGYMSSQDSTLAWVNWAEQSINTVSQLCLMCGTLILHKAGLKDLKITA